MRVAYLTSVYPAISHTFIYREINELRKNGICVGTYSIRPCKKQDLVGEEILSEYEKTHVVLKNPLKVALGFLFSFCRHPPSFISLILLSQRFTLPLKFKQRLLNLAYLAEGIYLAKELKKNNFSHVHVHFGNGALSTAFFACRFDRTLSYSASLHGPSDFEEPSKGQLSARLQEATFVRCISEYCKKTLKAVANVPDSKLHIVHCGVDLNYFQKASLLPTELIKIISVGRLVKEKGFDVLIKAFAGLSAQSRMPVQLSLVGEGSELLSLKNLSRDLGVEAKLNFCGALSVSRVNEELSHSHVFALASSAEGVPLVLMEAMAKGLAVVATSIAGIPELIENGRNGFLVKANSPEELSLVLLKLCEETSLRAAVAGPARETIECDWNIAHESAKMLELFKRQA